MTRADPLVASSLWRHASLRAVAVLIAVVSSSSCAHPEAPAPLVELRQVVDSPSVAQAQRAAPDLVAESQRSMRLAEEALQRHDVAQARWLATLGVTQARIAVAVSRQQAASSRREAASIALQRVEEDLARFRAQQTDAQNEIRRLEAQAERTPSSSTGPPPDRPARQ
jgi:hypothetical protein